MYASATTMHTMPMLHVHFCATKAHVNCMLITNSGTAPLLAYSYTHLRAFPNTVTTALDNDMRGSC